MLQAACVIGRALADGPQPQLLLPLQLVGAAGEPSGGSVVEAEVFPDVLGECVVDLGVSRNGLPEARLRIVVDVVPRP